MRAIAGPAAALLGGSYALAVLIELDLTVPIYWATCRDNLDWNGKTYLGGRQGGVNEIKDQGGEVLGLSFSISGVPSDLIAIALSEPIQGKRASISLAIMEPVRQQIVDVIPLWTGDLDQMPISESGGTATIAVTAEHRGIVFARPKGVMYSDADQQRLHPGDRCLEFLTSQSAHQDIWPAAAWFRA